MTSVCIKDCVDDVQEPGRAAYVKLNRGRESDMAKPVKETAVTGGGCRRCVQQPQVVDSISCRQLYLNSYKFSKKRPVCMWTPTCFNRTTKKANHPRKSYPRKRKCGGPKRVKKLSGSTLLGFFCRLLCF